MDGILITARQQMGPCREIWEKLMWDVRGGKFTYADDEREITKLYTDPANINIPIVHMRGVAARLLRGEKPEATETNLADLRRVYLNR